jgi:serine/threonine protein phosphatase PrpC
MTITEQTLQENLNFATQQQAQFNLPFSTFIGDPAWEQNQDRTTHNHSPTATTVQMIGKTKWNTQTQEDTYDITSSTVPELEGTPGTDDVFFASVLAHTFERLQQKLEKELGHQAIFSTGSTAVISMLVGSKLYTGNVGDSSAFLSTPQGIQQLIIRHNPKDNQRETDRITQAGGAVVPSGNWVGRLWTDPNRTNPADSVANSRAFGDGECEISQLIHTPDITSINIGTGAKFAQCSDGVTDYFKPDELQQFMQKNEPVSDLAIGIAQDVARRGAHDNTTIQVVELKPLAAGQVQIFSVFDGHGGDAVSNFLAANAASVLTQTMALHCKYKKLLAKVPASNTDQSTGNMYDDLKSKNPFYNFLSKLIEQDPDFAETLTVADLENYASLTKAVSRSLRESLSSILAYNDMLTKRKTDLVNKKNPQTKFYQQDIDDHIREIEAIQKEIEVFKRRVESEGTNLEKFIELQGVDKRIREAMPIVEQHYVNLIGLVGLYATPAAEGSFIIIDRAPLKAVFDAAVVAQADPSNKNENIPPVSAFSDEKTQKRGADAGAVESDIFRTGADLSAESSVSKKFPVFFNNQAIKREELAGLRATNASLDKALDYYNISMQEGANAYLHNALGFNVAASKVTSRFVEVEGDIYFISEAEGYSYRDDNQQVKTLPGAAFTVYKFNNNAEEEGFEWVGLYATNNLLGTLIQNSSVHQTVSDEQIRQAQEDELQRSLEILKIFKNKQNPIPYVGEIYEKIKTIHESHADIADVQLLTRTAVTVAEVARHATGEDLKEHADLLSQVHDKYQYDSNLSTYFLTFLFVAGVVAMATGIGELFLAAAAFEIALSGLVSVLMSPLLYADKKYSKDLAETRLTKRLTASWDQMHQPKVTSAVEPTLTQQNNNANVKNKNS